MTYQWRFGPPGDEEMPAGNNHRYAMWDGAYVLGSLSATERRDFEAHMADCPSCRQAVAELRGLPAPVAQPSPKCRAAIQEARNPSGGPEISPKLLPSLLA